MACSCSRVPAFNISSNLSFKKKNTNNINDTVTNNNNNTNDT